jgi:parallel beta-helix repeat protein
LYYQTTQGNVFRHNLIYDNYNGIYILQASNNSIYLNNFLNNTHHYNLTGLIEVSNTWDNGYPSGGNYWDDYIGIDVNADGIGDTPYVIHGDGNQDRYPLVNYPQRYGVKLSCPDKEQTVPPKGNTSYEILVTNTGNIIDNITLFLPPPCKCGWMESLNSQTLELLPSQNKTVLLNITTIWDLPIPVWYWTTKVTATSQGNPTKSDTLTVNTTIVNHTTVSVEPPSQAIKEGESFTISIAIDPYEPIAGVQCSLNFDPSLLICNEVSQGDLFQENTFFINGTIDNIKGEITGIVESAIQTNTSLAGTFATIHFTTHHQSGISPLNLTNVEIGTPNGTPSTLQIYNGSVTVSWTPGDINNDGHTNILDLIMISQHWKETGIPGWAAWDINNDGIINILDAIMVGQHWTG